MPMMKPAKIETRRGAAPVDSGDLVPDMSSEAFKVAERAHHEGRRLDVTDMTGEQFKKKMLSMLAKK